MARRLTCRQGQPLSRLAAAALLAQGSLTGREAQRGRKALFKAAEWGQAPLGVFDSLSHVPFASVALLVQTQMLDIRGRAHYNEDRNPCESGWRAWKAPDAQKESLLPQCFYACWRPLRCPRCLLLSTRGPTHAAAPSARCVPSWRRAQRRCANLQWAAPRWPLPQRRCLYGPLRVQPLPAFGAL